jgi:hypothetical protein
MTRHRSDTVKGAQEIISGAIDTINPPVGVELGEVVRPYWDKLVKAKAGRSWNDQDLFMLVELSRNLFRTEWLSFQMLTEDEIIETGQGLKANPKSDLLDLLGQLVKFARLIMIYLQVHPEATQGKARDQVLQNLAHGKVAGQYEDDDYLLARPKLDGGNPAGAQSSTTRGNIGHCGRR